MGGALTANGRSTVEHIKTELNLIGTSKHFSCITASKSSLSISTYLVRQNFTLDLTQESDVSTVSVKSKH